MNNYLTLTVADKLSLTLEGLMRAVAACSDRRRPGGPLAAWLINLIWTKVSRTHQRIQGLLTRFQAGRLRVTAARPTVARGAGARGAPRAGAVKGLPQHTAWLLPLVPCAAANYASQLRILLAEPEMMALLEASPQARRVLKPLCRMLGVELTLLTPPRDAASGQGGAPKAAEAELDEVAVAWNRGVVLRMVTDHPPPGDSGWRLAQAP